MHIRIFFILWMYLIVSVASAQTDASRERHYDCRNKSGSIVVNGIADEIAWQLAPVVGEFTRVDRPDVSAVTHRTTAKMLWDEDNLYILMTVDDSDIWSTMTVNEVACLCREETVEVFLDPDGDGLDYAELHFNCLNTYNDIWIPRNTFKYRDGKPIDWKDLYSWNITGIQHAVMNYGTVNDSTDVDLGTVYEIAIPFKGLGKIAGSANIPPKPGDVWRMSINRYERSPRSENEELSTWCPPGFHATDRYGFVRFVDRK